MLTGIAYASPEGNRMRSQSTRGPMLHEPALFPALSENRLIRRLAMLVTELDLDRRDFVIFGSGPLLAHGLRYGIRDLDIVARGSVWQHVSEYGCRDTGSINGAPVALFWNGLIQFSQGWISDDWDADDLIGRAESVQGWPFAQLTDVLAYKQMLLRPKDHLDIAALHQATLQSALRAAAASRRSCRFSRDLSSRSDDTAGTSGEAGHA